MLNVNLNDLFFKNKPFHLTFLLCQVLARHPLVIHLEVEDRLECDDQPLQLHHLAGGLRHYDQFPRVDFVGLHSPFTDGGLKSGILHSFLEVFSQFLETFFRYFAFPDDDKRHMVLLHPKLIFLSLIQIGHHQRTHAGLT